MQKDGNKVGVHSLRPGTGYVRQMIEAGAAPRVAKGVDDVDWLIEVKGIDAGIVTIARFEIDGEIGEGVNGIERVTDGDYTAFVETLFAPIEAKLAARPELRDAVDYWEICNEPAPPADNAASYCNLGELMIACMARAEQVGIRLGLLALNAGTPEWWNMQQLVATGMFARAQAGGHIVTWHDGVFRTATGWQPVDIFYGTPIPAQPDRRRWVQVRGDELRFIDYDPATGGAPPDDWESGTAGPLTFRYRFLYHLLRERGEVVPLVVSEFRPGVSDYVKRFAWYEGEFATDWYAMAVCPFSWGLYSNEDWGGADMDAQTAALAAYMVGVAGRANGAPPPPAPDPDPEPGKPEEPGMVEAVPQDVQNALIEQMRAHPSYIRPIEPGARPALMRKLAAEGLMPVVQETYVKVNGVTFAGQAGRPNPATEAGTRWFAWTSGMAEAVEIGEGMATPPASGPARPWLAIDLSQHNATDGSYRDAGRDWERLRRVLPLVVQRATIGARGVDALWAEFARNATTLRGAYHLLTSDDPAAQIRHFHATVTTTADWGAAGWVVPTLDYEVKVPVAGGDWRPLPAAHLLTAVEATKAAFGVRRVLVYSADWYMRRLSPGELSALRVRNDILWWWAVYPQGYTAWPVDGDGLPVRPAGNPLRPPGFAWDVWQFTSSGRVPGVVDQTIDLNVLNVAAETLLAANNRPNVARYDLLDYLRGDGRTYELRDQDGAQRRAQTQRGRPGEFFQVKQGHGGDEWEQMHSDEEYIWRGADTSPGDGRYYVQSDPDTPGRARWALRHMGVGQTFRGGTHYVQFYRKSDCAPSAASSGPAMNETTLVAHHPVWLSPYGIAVADVIELAGRTERFWFGRGYGLVGWQRTHEDAHTPEASYISELHAPGARPNLVREAIPCLQV